MINKKEKLDINNLLNHLKYVLKSLNMTSYNNSLYTEYDACEWDKSFTPYTLHESIKQNTSYELLDAIKLIINLLFEWDYKLEARFDISIDNEVNIIFHRPRIEYDLEVAKYKKF